MAHLVLATFLVGSTWFRLRRLAAAIQKAKSAGQGKVASRPMFWIMTAGYFVYLVCCATEGWMRASSFSVSVFFNGLGLYVLALSLREIAMRDLGRFFSPNIEIRNQHRVVRDGLYRYVRHPLLLCMALEVVAVGIVCNAPQTLLRMGFGFYFPLIGIRWFLEERELLKSLGEEYRRYQKDVNAFIPKMTLLFGTEKEFSHG